jgi:molecular chaperone GrpE
MTLQQLRLLLGRHGIVSDEIVGQPFDPHQHEAISQRHDPAQADHTILDMFQRGYRRGAKVLRPAKVVVNDLTSAPPPRPAR